MAKFWTIVGVAVAAVAAFLAVFALRSGESGPDVEAFRNSKARPEFCKEAEPLDFSRSAELSAHRRAHVVEDLRELAPDDIAGEFDRLIEWYEHPNKEERDRSRQASVRVGEFIERSCDEINLGGIRG
ncbi:hypothetical protein [Streptomyces sp. Ag109_G2-15]|uniref:hypothetical protein n=1 Tax=Streptomyces sp. Ag109_G2-15 TaxID=1938850 RepID=UPI000BCE1D2E|nr:hypothetical protein [Streptomyces sp. Ag109_G2-15]SOD86260.1 hypothetical protein SAMN06272765_3711 [Streptomyces sp. Ag109_G2-15]